MALQKDSTQTLASAACHRGPTLFPCSGPKTEPFFKNDTTGNISTSFVINYEEKQHNEVKTSGGKQRASGVREGLSAYTREPRREKKLHV